jgi:hypothetical protein
MCELSEEFGKLLRALAGRLRVRSAQKVPRVAPAKKKECEILRQSVRERPFDVSFCGNKRVWQIVAAPSFCCRTLLRDVTSRYSL